MQGVSPPSRVPLIAVLFIILCLVGIVLASTPTTAAAAPPTGGTTYINPILPVIPAGGVAESCADPSVMRGQTQDDPYWYLFCTTDPLNDEDQDGKGNYNFHLIPMFRSMDLVNWTYMGDAFTERPAWSAPTAGIWAPEIQYFNDQYYMYYGITDVTDATSGEVGCDSDNAIGVATSDSPLGPWVDSGAPVVAPRRGGGGCNFFWTYDPEVTTTPNGDRYIYYGSYYGGIEVRALSEDGTSAPVETAVAITIPNRYEGSEVYYRDGFYYLFVSATNCCAGPLTGYSVFTGRAATPTGPFVDREGVSLLDARVGGTPSLSLNGNQWVGPGHNSVFTDFDGQVWTFYHAVNENEPYFEGAVGFTKRPLLLDPVDWVNGWPTVRGGYWISNSAMPGPAAQPGDTTGYEPQIQVDPQPGALIADLSDEFNTGPLGAQWSWVREPVSDTYGFNTDGLFINTQDADLYVDNNSASVLTEDTPIGDYVVETRMQLNVAPDGCCFNYVQGGLVIYGDDDNFIKLVHASIWETRQTEFAKEASPVPENFPRYGNTVIGPPTDWTYLRIVKQTLDGEEQYTGYTSRDGVAWVRGGTWSHDLGADAQIGLVSMGISGFVSTFDYVRVYELQAPTAVTVTDIAASSSGAVLWVVGVVGILMAGGIVAVTRKRTIL